MWAIIGGSGFEKFEGFKVLERLETQTPFGEAASGLCKAELDGHQFLFLSRHGQHHEVLPSHINYKANIYALKKFGAKAILSFSAVGSLREELAPGDLVIPVQYIDRTKRTASQTTYFADERVGSLVGHMAMGDPIEPRIFPILREVLNDFHQSKENELLKSSKPNKSLFKAHFNKTYICMEGPNFSTRAESKMYQGWGADIIGMTNFPEYALAREANMLYVPLCFVTDYDCWRVEEEPVTLEAVIAIMRANNAKGFQLIVPILENTDLNDIYINYRSGFPVGIMNSLEKLTPDQKRVLEILS